MASSGFGPYHSLWRGDAPSKRMDISPTSGVMTLALGVGVRLLLSELTSIDGRADDARTEGWSKIWREGKDNDAPAQVQMQKILCHLFQVTHRFARGTSNVSSH